LSQLKISLQEKWGKRQWCQKFGPGYVRKFKKRQGRLDDTRYIDEVSGTIQGQRQYFWPTTHQDGDVIAQRVRPILFAAR
jgi:transposase-like protein